jgi:hypothetical protein
MLSRKSTIKLNIFIFIRIVEGINNDGLFYVWKIMPAGL